MRLADNVGLEELAADHGHVAAKVGAKPGVKIGSLVAGMIVGADGIDGMDLLRHGAIPATFGGIRAPSTLGSLRAFAHGDAQTLLLPGADTLVLVDIDSVQRRVYRASKQGAVFGTPRSRGTSGCDARATGGNAHLWSVFTAGSSAGRPRTSTRAARHTGWCP